MKRLGIDMPRSKPAFSVEEAEAIASELGYPVVIRPAYTMGGTGGGLFITSRNCVPVASRASQQSRRSDPGGRIGSRMEELELEVVRDSKNQMITVCFIENVDAMGVHTETPIARLPC